MLKHQEGNKQSFQLQSQKQIIFHNTHLQQKVFGFQKHTISYLMLMLSCFAWVSGYIYSNQSGMSPFETTISRYTIMFFVTYIHCRLNGSPLVFSRRPYEKTLIVRNLIIAFHSFVVSYMQFYLPLGVFHTLVISGQVFIFLANYLLRDVKITTRQMISAGISFIGLALIINGRLIYQVVFKGQEFESQFQNYSATDTFTQIKMGFLYVLWNAIWAVSVIYTKIPQYNTSQILFSQSFTSIIIAGIGYIFFDSTDKVSFQVYLPSIILCGIILMIANYFFAYGIMWSSNTGISTMMLMTSAVFGYFISIYRYNQRVNFVSLFGTVVLVSSAGYVVYQQEKLKK